MCIRDSDSAQEVVDPVAQGDHTSFSSKNSFATTQKSISSAMEKSGRGASPGSEFTTDEQRIVFEALEACFRVSTPTEKLKLVQSLSKSWRVPFDPKNAKKAMSAISLRASKQIERRSARVARELKSASIQGEAVDGPLSGDLNQEVSWQISGVQVQQSEEMHLGEDTSSADFGFNRAQPSNNEEMEAYTRVLPQQP
eukprot:TRINITY_DN2346_c0_g1_i19.p1 TRINITY_DN2346_c0_g1~~TRINITY_DN2346_c0_g1_i19.p1  ORF type:complete len:197 (+),score=48.75 TRINITY_DN2346_c0_g1_i19:77-667(+)